MGFKFWSDQNKATPNYILDMIIHKRHPQPLNIFIIIQSAFIYVDDKSTENVTVIIILLLLIITIGL